MFYLLLRHNRGSCSFGTKPSILCPFYRLHQCGPSQSMEAFGISMIKYPPVTIYIIYQSSMSFRPPILRTTICMHNRIIWRILPWTSNIFRSGGNHHVTCCRTCCSSLCRNKIVITIMIIQFGSLQTHTLRFPCIGILPAVIYLHLLTDRRQSVCREPDNRSIIDIQITIPVLIGYMSRINATHFQVDRLTPRTFDIFCPYYPVSPC